MAYGYWGWELEMLLLANSGWRFSLRAYLHVQAEMTGLNHKSWFCFSKLNCISISGSATVRRAFEFGRTHVVRPKGKHQATVVWLHGLGDNGAR